VATAWAILFERDAGANNRSKRQEIECCAPADNEDLDGKTFYPLTFPITAGPGTLVVMLTLGAHASQADLSGKVAAYSGIVIASALSCGAVTFVTAMPPR
jgi:multiple antibiotic resistance protein